MKAAWKDDFSVYALETDVRSDSVADAKVATFELAISQELDAGALLQLLSWASSLRRAGKRVSIDVGSSAGPIVNHIDALQFGTAVSAQGIKFRTAQVRGLNPDPTFRVVAPVGVFTRRAQIRAYVERFVEPQLAMFSEASVGSSGQELAGLLIAELLANCFDHAPGHTATAAITECEFRSIRPEMENFIEADFLRKHVGKRLLQVVVADTGPGIPGTLQDTWNRDGGRTESERTTELNVLRYSFRKNSTSKFKEQEYVNEINERLLGRRGPRLTGLYYARSEVARLSGHLGVRSGASWFGWDFSASVAGSRKSHLDSQKLQGLTAWPGTVLRVFLPVARPERRSRDRVHLGQLDVSGSVEFDRSELVVVAPDDFSDPEERVEECISAITRIRFAYGQVARGGALFVILDGPCLDKNTSLTLLYSVAGLQERERPIVIVSIVGSSSTLIAIGRQFEVDLEVAELPILCLNERSEFSLLGATQAVLHAFKDAVRGDLATVVDELAHLVSKPVSQVTYFAPRIGAGIVQEVVQRATEALLRKWGETPGAAPFCHQGRFLLAAPSSAYCERFWEVGAIARDANKAQALGVALAYRLRDFSVERLVVLSKAASVVVQIAVDELRALGEARIPIVLEIDRPEAKIGFSRYLAAKQSTLLVTDVIGTGELVQSVVNSSLVAQLEAVLCVVDAREDVEGDIVCLNLRVPVSALIAAPQRYSRDLPPGWRLGQVQVIDKVLGRPVPRDGDTAPDELRSLWASEPGQPSEALERCAAVGGISVGHFGSPDRHFSTFVIARRLFEEFRDELLAEILRDLRNAREVSNDEFVVTHVFYNAASSPGLVEVAQQLASGEGQVVPIDVTMMMNQQRVFEADIDKEVDTVVVLDPAASTGRTLQNLLLAACRHGARRVFAYLLVDRMSRLHAEFIEDTRYLGGANIEVSRFLRLASPSYQKEDCPQCRAKKQYAQGSLLTHRSELVFRLDERERAYSLTPIKEFLDLTTVAATDDRLVGLEAEWQAKLHNADRPEKRKRLLERLGPMRHDPGLECCAFLLAVSREYPLFRDPEDRLYEHIYPRLRASMGRLAMEHVSTPGIPEEVRDAALTILVHFGLRDSIHKWIRTRQFQRGQDGWWHQVQLTERQRIATSAEILSWFGSLRQEEAERVAPELRRWGRAAARLDGMHPIPEILVALPEHGSWPHPDAATLRDAWMACNSWLQRHSPIRTGLGNVINDVRDLSDPSSVISVLANDGLDVIRHIRDDLLPMLRVFFSCGVVEKTMGAWPLRESDLNDLARMIGDCSEDIRSLTQAGKRSSDESRQIRVITSLLFAIREDLFGSTSGSLFGDEELFTSPSRYVAAISSCTVSRWAPLDHVLARADRELTTAGIKVSMNLQPIPEGQAILMAPEDLGHILNQLKDNLLKRAFPASFSKERRASFEACVLKDEYEITVSDNGIGASAVRLEEHHGLWNVRELVEHTYQGEMSWDSEDRGGFEVRLRLPMVRTARMRLR